MALESSKYDIIYGKLLSLGFEPTYAKEFAKTLYQISKELHISVNEILKYVTEDGLRFENEIYDRLNKLRTNSSQIGFLDQNNIPSAIADQVTQNYEVTPSPTPSIAYFRVTDGVVRNYFVIKLTDPAKIQNARDQLNNIVPQLSITGLIIKSTADYNPNYSYHYDPDTIDFFEYAMEVCDATFNYTEENLADAGGAFLPGLRLGPWGRLLVEEVSSI